MDRPGKRGSSLSWFVKLFGFEPEVSPTSPEPSQKKNKPKLSPFEVEQPEQPQKVSPSSPNGIRTTYERNDATLLKQLQEANKYRGIIEAAALRYQLQPAVLCGIGSRESHWGLALRPIGPGGRGDFARRAPRGERKTAEPPDGPGYGRGLMQIDYDWHEFARTGQWQNPRENIFYACQILEQAKIFFKRNQVYLPSDQMLRAILAAYNGGATATLQAIRAGKDIDANTTGRDYSRDVLNRSGWFQLHGWR
jgi:hypothetical protein